MVQNIIGDIMKEFDFENVIFHDEHMGAQIISKNRTTPIHKHKFVELIYIKEGTGVQEINGIPYTVKRGDFLFVNYGQTHYIKPEGVMTYFEVMFDLEFISRELINKNNAFDILTLSSFDEFDADLDDTAVPKVNFSGEEMYAIEHILKDLVNELSYKSPLYKNVIHGYVEALFSKLMRKLADHLPDGLNSEKQDVLFKILEYINKNLSEDISLEDLATRSFYNPSYFSRIFKERFGMGFKAYITKLRTEKAAELLKNTTLSVKEIMTHCGFNDKNSFYRALEKWYNTTPTKLREMHIIETKTEINEE